MMKKKIFRVFLCGVFLIILTGCGKTTPTGELVEIEKSIIVQSL